MGKAVRIVLILAAVLILLVAALLAFVLLSFPRTIPAPALVLAATPELVARGDYLFNHGCSCVACHSQRDWTRLDAPVRPGTEGMGGERFGAEAGVPGVIYGRNLTPAALAGWSDGEIYRAIASGVDRDGRALFPMMPYGHYAQLADGDLRALVAYMRTLKPIANAVPPRELKFPMNLIVRTIPKPAQPPATAPVPGDHAYPAYVVNAAACLHCHSPSSHGAIAPGAEFTGGVEFPIPGLGIVRSANLTPDPATGIGSWTREMFVKRFTSSLQSASQQVKPGEFTSPMPWVEYAGMTEQDLGAIYDYLHALAPVAKPVQKVTPLGG
jgi:mono/diheme cytochrome c family protein